MGFAVIVLVIISFITLAANFLINKEFEKYIGNQQKNFAESLADNMAFSYDMEAGEWNLDYVHGFGMYALNDGYIICILDADGTVVWDAENHDMALCHEIMNTIELRMQEQNPKAKGDFVTHEYTLSQNGGIIGTARISYYTPYYYNDNDFRFIQILNEILIITGVVSLISAVFAGTVLARRIVRPLVKTMEVTKEISDGNYKIRFETPTKTKELCELTQSVNQMARSLEEQEKLRRRLTSDVAHELRTPIANVSAQLEAIIEGVWEPNEERLQGCYDELGRLSELVTDMEELRQIENEKMILEKEQVDLIVIAETVKQSFERETVSRGIAFTVEGEPAIVWGDRKRLHQAVYNLVSNAVKYSKDNGTIAVTVCNMGKTASISVKDSGIGIAEEELPFIFERFYRTDNSRSRKTGGSGIGLTIVKAVIEAHGGKIEVESQVGQGSCFTVILPPRSRKFCGPSMGICFRCRLNTIRAGFCLMTVLFSAKNHRKDFRG